MVVQQTLRHVSFERRSDRESLRMSSSGPVSPEAMSRVEGRGPLPPWEPSARADVFTQVSHMPTIAAIDVGTNAMRLAIGRIGADHHIELLENIREPVRLGKDVFADGSISEETTERAIEAFQKFAKLIDKYGAEHVKAVATSATREALNSDIFIDRIAQATGLEIATIGGEEEARLIHLAVAERVNLRDKRAILIDIGGGSVEVTLALDGNIQSTISFNMGTVRLLQKLGQAQVGEQRFNQLVHEYAEATRNWLETKIAGNTLDLCVATGGNAEALGDLRKKVLGRDSASVITRHELDVLVDTLQHMTFAERLQELRLRPDRADVIVPAAIVLQTIVRQAAVDQVLVPGVGLKDGLLLDIVQDLYDRQHRLHRDQVLASALQVGRKYAFDEPHATAVAGFAVQMFDKTQQLHHLDEESRLLLEVAALLHDIGHFISATEHHKHTFYLLNATPLIGLTKPQRAIIANVARYHRKSAPSLQHEPFKVLPAKDRVIVSKLAALLRVADALDTEHAAQVTSLAIEYDRPRLLLTVAGRGDLLLEKWALVKRIPLFEEVFGVKVIVAE
jgi:exopolyphosphatase/guanosine-5'-triphosphate,3'-diphosphate pyrophosphatase